MSKSEQICIRHGSERMSARSRQRPWFLDGRDRPAGRPTQHYVFDSGIVWIKFGDLVVTDVCADDSCLLHPMEWRTLDRYIVQVDWWDDADKFPPFGVVEEIAVDLPDQNDTPPAFRNFATCAVPKIQTSETDPPTPWITDLLRLKTAARDKWLETFLHSEV